MKKKIKIIICSLCLLFIILLIIIVCLIFGKNSKKNHYKSGVINLGDIYYDKSVKKISNEKLKSEHCNNGVCISNVVLKCSKNYGVIYYDIVKKDDKKCKYGVISFGTDKVLYIDLNDLEKGNKKSGTLRFRKQDLSKVKDFKFKAYNDNNVSFVK